MEYNTNRTKMIIAEYGRNIHKMIYNLMEIKDRKKRNECSLEVIKVMGYLNPHLRDVPDFQHKLWDQLFIMSDFKLEIDSPFPRPEPEQFKSPPNKIPYCEALNEFRYYGKITRDLIKIALDCKDEKKKEGLFYVIANTMKKNYLKWNKETVEDEIIFKDLEKISEGKINLKNKDSLLSAERILSSSKKRKNYVAHVNGTNNKKKRFDFRTNNEKEQI